jgi:ribosome-associated protein
MGTSNPMNQRMHLSLSVGEKPINLAQVLKLANCAQSGGEAKLLIAEGLVKVNGEIELRKRRQMKVGDTVVLDDGPTIVLSGSAIAEE